MAQLLIGLDDTDNADSRGTGYLARALLEECGRRGLVVDAASGRVPRKAAVGRFHVPGLGVTRHQFLVDPRIPYTSHNSGACVAVEGADGAKAGDGAAAWAFAFDFVAGRSAPGSDPGVCVARAGDVPAEVIDFGRRASTEILEAGEAIRLAKRAGLALRPLGGSGLGVIGALASVGLRAGGGDGRFIDLPGLRELPARVGAEELVRLGIRLDHRGTRRCGPGDAYDTLGWVRPRLIGGGPVLPVEWSEENHAWVPVDRRHNQQAR